MESTSPGIVTVRGLTFPIWRRSRPDQRHWVVFIPIGLWPRLHGCHCVVRVGASRRWGVGTGGIDLASDRDVETL